MNKKFEFADFHCHPNLKTYGHSFDKDKTNKKQNVWYHEPPRFFTKMLNIMFGVTRFSQSDFTTLSKGGGKIIFASLYPFEKGFFINSAGKGPFSAWLSDLVTGIGYQRVRNLQEHSDYFNDLEKEYTFFLESQKSCKINNQEFRWRLIANHLELNKSLATDNEIGVILSIEGAHVFNSGLTEYGRPISEIEIIENIRKVKSWEHSPFYITFAHNFNNDLCGHAQSLEPIKHLVDQTKGMNTGFTSLGIKVLHELLSSKKSRPIYIDIKHMSLESRKDYFKILESDYSQNMPPTIVSHGAVNGLSITNKSEDIKSRFFYSSDINFYNEEIVHIGKSGGLFAIQFDARRIAKSELVKKSFNSLFKKDCPSLASELIWRQIQHISEVLDNRGHFGWGTTCIGSDYDGTINPLPGVWTSEYFSSLYDDLLAKANNYLKNPNPLSVKENREITPEEIVRRFFLDNTVDFINRFF